MTDDRVQHYRLLHRLGAGGMGEVYLAEDPRLGRQLALKLLPAEFAQDANRRARFLTEARAAAALNHPNICTVYDAGETAEGRLFIALELLEGETLDVRLKHGPLEVTEVVRIGVQLASAMEAAHAKGILHRDLKPANLHLDARGHLKVLDFGLAKRLVPEPGSAEDSTQGQTRTGGILGTPQYMSPEQALGKALDPRSDLFSCGAVLYELLTGRGPFGGPTFAELLEQIVHRPPEAIARFNYAVPVELERVVLKCLQKDPDRRYQSARELAVDLRGVEAQIRGAAVNDQPGTVQVVTWVLVGTNAEELERTVGVHETARILRDFQQEIGRGLRKFSQARQEASLGSTVLLSFARPSNAVQWALKMVAGTKGPLQCRAGLHLGEAAAAMPEAGERYRGQLTVCERLLQLARPGQVLLGRAVFDSARQVLPAGSVEDAAELSWVSHGPYLFEGIEGPIEVCEVGVIGRSHLSAPKTSDKAQRQVRPDEEPVLGWRPAVGQAVPNTPWVLVEKLGEGGFGEVWVAQHPKLRERRVFKFCFQADRVRALKRELTLFRLLKERVGDHPNIVRLHEVYLDEPPFYLEEEFVEGKDLRTWCEAHGGVERIPLTTRLEIVAQAAEALQAAHDAGIIHRDVKPGNILITGKKSEAEVIVQESEGGGQRAEDPEGAKDNGLQLAAHSLRVKLADFGIGQVISADYLKGVTLAGFTQTMVGSTNSGTGTTMYLAPELIAGGAATIRSDIYSLGVVLYQLLTGDFQRPLTADWSAAVSDPLLREDLHECLKWDPNQRFKASASLAERLRHHPQRTEQLRQEELAGRSAARRRVATLALAGAAALLMLLALALGYGLKRAKAAENRARRHLYAADMLLAAEALQAGNRGRAFQLLERNRPSGSGDPAGWEWRYLWSRCRSEASALRPAHDDLVSDVAFSPEGLLYSASLDRTIKVWDVSARSLIASHTHPGPIQAMALSPNGHWLVTGGPRHQLILWDTRTWVSKPVATHEATIMDLVISPNGERLAVRCGSRVRVLEVNNWSTAANLQASGSDKQAQSMAFSPGGELLAYPAGASVAVCRLEGGASIRQLPGSMDQINSIAISPDGATVVAADWSPQIAVWDLTSDTQVARLTNHTAWVSSVLFMPDGDLLISAGADQSLRHWDTRSWRELATRRGHLDEISCLAVSRAGDVLATGGKDGSLNMWNPEVQPKPATRLSREGSRAWLSLDGSELLAVGPSNRMVRYDASTFERIDTNTFVPYERHGTRIVVELGVHLVAVGTAEGEVEIWETAMRSPITEWTVSSNSITALQFSPDESLLAALDGLNSLSIWDIQERREIARVEAVAPGESTAFSPGNQFLAAVSLNNSVQVWSLDPPRLLDTLTGQRQMTTVAFSPGGDSLAVASADASLRLWHFLAERVIPLPRALMAYFCVVFAPDGRRIAAAGPDPVVRIIDANTGEEVSSLDRGARYRDFVNQVRFSPDGNVLQVLSDTSLTVWRAASFAEIKAAEHGGLASWMRPSAE